MEPLMKQGKLLLHTTPVDTDPFDTEIEPGVEGRELKVKNTGHLIDLLSQNMDQVQPLREIVQNSIESFQGMIMDEPKKVLVTPDWVDIEKTIKNGGQPIYRMTVIDNGCGMDAEELERHLMNLAESGKVLGLRDNFGMGGRLATLSISPHAVVYMSWKDGCGSQAVMRLRPDGSYELKPFKCSDDEYEVVVEAPEYYRTENIFDRKQIIGDHGTIVILYGTHTGQHTYFQMEKSGEVIDLGCRNHVKALNGRYLEVPKDVSIKIWESNTSEVKSMAKSRKQATYRGKDGVGGMFRTIQGVKRYLDDLASDKGTVEVSCGEGSNVMKAKIHWWLRVPEGEEPKFNMDGGTVNKDPHAMVINYGTFGFTMNKEIYDVSPTQAIYRWKHFRLHVAGGKSFKKRIAILVEPDPETTGACNDASRSRIIYKNGMNAPVEAWGEAFAKNMPKALKNAKVLAIGNISSDDISKKVLEDLEKHFKEDLSKHIHIIGGRTRPTGTRRSPKKRIPPKRNKTAYDNSRMRHPLVRWASLDDDIAADFDNIGNIVTLNIDFSELMNLSSRASQRHPSINDDAIMEAARNVFEIRMVSRIMHAARYKKRWPVDRYIAMLSSEALTLAALGIYDADAALNNVLKHPKFKNWEEVA